MIKLQLFDFIPHPTDKATVIATLNPVADKILIIVIVNPGGHALILSDGASSDYMVRKAKYNQSYILKNARHEGQAFLMDLAV